MTKCKECGHEKVSTDSEFTYNGVTWSTKLLNDGKSLSQKQWNEYLENTPWRLPTTEEYRSLYGCPDEQFMTSVNKNLDDLWLMTSCFLKSPYTGEETSITIGLHDYVNGPFIDAIYYRGYGYRPARGVKK